MIVQSNALCSRLLRLSCKLSATRPERFSASIILPRRAYAHGVSSLYRANTILQDSDQGPASTCWSLLSPYPSVIASNLSTLKLPKANLISGETPLVVLLVTPAHIKLLDDGSAFIPSLLKSTVENAAPRQDFNLLAAVVDRIPQTSSTTSYGSQRSDSVDAATSPKTRVEDGSEGISVAVLESATAAPDLWSPKHTSNERETMTIQQRCTLSFLLPPSPGIPTQLSDKSRSHPLVKRMLQLPVANTVFQNGRTSTLFAQRWVINFRTKSISEHLSSNKKWLPQQAVYMDNIFADNGMRLQLDTRVQSHLVPITPTRTITAAVGNIVRKISGGDASAEAVPASEELEKAIHTVIEQSQISAQQPGVWALIRPQKHAALDRRAEIQGTVRDMIGHAVLSGARLRKVLSGGGGWGEKHGLLALDPDSHYSRRHQATGPSPSFGKDPDAEAESYGALGEVVKLEDKIRFYVCTSPSDAHTADLRAPMFWSSSQPVTATLVFGSLPSTMDAMPQVDDVEAKDHAQSDLILEEKKFGMLSEQGMSLESLFLSTNIPANRMQYLRIKPHISAYRVRRTNTTATKLDAPYTTFTIRGQSSTIPVSSEVKEEGFKPLNIHLQDLMPPEPSTVTATTKSAPTLVQKLPKTNKVNQEAQQFRQGYLKAGRALAQSRVDTGEKHSKMIREDPRARMLEESQVLSKTARMDRNDRERGKTDHEPTLPIRFTCPIPDRKDHKATLDVEAQDALPVVVRRHLCASSGDLDQNQKPIPVPIIREESEGKAPGTALKGQEGNLFMIRKHFTWNPFERTEEIRRVGEISSREQAMGLHGQYHLALDALPEETRES